MKRFLLAGAAAAVLGLAAPAAQANLKLTAGPDGLHAGNIPGANVSNEALTPLGFNTPLAGYYGSTVNVTKAGTIKFEFLGFEAGADNQFRYTGAPGPADNFTFSTAAIPGANNQWQPTGIWATAPSQNPVTRSVVAGVLGFNFFTDFTNPDSSVANGSNPFESPTTQSKLNFFATFGQPVPGPGNPGDTATEGSVLYLFFDDRGGNRQVDPTCRNTRTVKCATTPDDDNHDDMVIRLTFTAAPVPEPASLALLGLGVAARRRRRA